MAGDLPELRGEGWKRLLAAARRSLERTGGALDRSIGLSSPADAERPWRMTAADYRRALETGESTLLTGSPTASPWDPELAALLAEHGRAVMEERLIAVLLTDLAQ